jgi:uncharacterized protein
MGRYVDIDGLERRYMSTGELRVDADASPKITGYAAVFNQWADIGGWFRESIKPGAFKKSIKENDIRALWNHDPSYVLGRNKSGTLKLREDDKGLAVEIDPVQATWANDLLASMRRGDVSQMSFGFTVNKADVNYDADERVLEDVTLFDVSVVTYPAYPTTSAEVRSAFEAKKAQRAADPELPPPDPMEELDRIWAKLKAKEELTEDELRAISAFVPNLPAPVVDHAGTTPEPVVNHSEADTRGVDRWSHKLAEYEKKYPTTKEKQGGS